MRSSPSFALPLLGAGSGRRLCCDTVKGRGTVALVNFHLPRLPTLAGSAGDEHRFLRPPTVPLTVLGRDGRANDTPLTLTHAHSTTRPHPHFEPLRANRGGRVRPAGLLFRSVGMRPTPYGGPGCPAPLWGAGAMSHSMCARPLMGGRAAPPPRGGLGSCLFDFVEGEAPRVFF